MIEIKNNDVFSVCTYNIGDVMSKGIHTFIVHIDQKNKALGSISMGLFERTEFNTKKWVGDTKLSTSLHSKGGVWREKKSIKKCPRMKFHQGDIIVCRIDFGAGVMSFSKNSTCQFDDNVKFKDDEEKREYYFAISLHRKQAVSVVKVPDRHEEENEKEEDEEDEGEEVLVQEDEKVIRVISKNLYNHLAVNSNGEKRLLGFASKVKNELGNPDILILQELFILKKASLGYSGKGTLNKFIKSLYEGGYFYFTNFVNTIEKYKIGVNSGLLIMSRHPIQKCEVHEFPYKARSSKGYMTMKGFIIAFLRCKGTDICVGDIHTDHTGNKKFRKKQLNQFYQRIKEIREEFKGKFIFAGDFNIAPQPKWDNGEEFQFLKDLMNEFEIVPFDGITYEKDGCTYDHMFHSKGMKVEDCRIFGFDVVIGEDETKKVEISDHKGLFASFSVI